MKLYSYWRSTTSYRVRAALNLKGISYETIPVDLVAGDQRDPDYVTLNPGKAVPTLVLEDGTTLIQSMAILDYLDNAYTAHPLLPTPPLERAKVMAAAHAIALDIHPVNNLRLIGRLKTRFKASPDDAQAWMRHWMVEGFEALEAMIDPSQNFAFGDEPDLADLCITAQVYNAHRWGLDLAPFPNIAKIEQNCLKIEAIHKAHPDQQPDAKA